MRQGLTTVALPAEKRLALSLIPLRASELLLISEDLAAFLAGSWFSGLFFRSVCAFELLLGCKEGATRAHAQELVLLSVLAPVICSNVAEVAPAGASMASC